MPHTVKGFADVTQDSPYRIFSFSASLAVPYSADSLILFFFFFFFFLWGGGGHFRPIS